MKQVQKLWFALEGYRTYIIAIITAVLNLAVAAGWISVDNLNAINIVLVALGGAALRSGIKRVE
jgi:hypothetical protein